MIFPKELYLCFAFFCNILFRQFLVFLLIFKECQTLSSHVWGSDSLNFKRRNTLNIFLTFKTCQGHKSKYTTLPPGEKNTFLSKCLGNSIGMRSFYSERFRMGVFSLKNGFFFPYPPSKNLTFHAGWLTIQGLRKTK